MNIYIYILNNNRKRGKYKNKYSSIAANRINSSPINIALKRINLSNYAYSTYIPHYSSIYMIISSLSDYVLIRTYFGSTIFGDYR